MAKIRVYELARELKIESKALLAKMQEIGITLPSHQSTLTVAQIDKIKASLDAAAKSTVVVRRRKKAPGEEEHTGEATAHAAEARSNEASAPVAAASSPTPASTASSQSLAGSAARVVRVGESATVVTRRREASPASSIPTPVLSADIEPSSGEATSEKNLTSKVSGIRHPTAQESSDSASIRSKVEAEAEAKSRKHVAAQKMADLAAQPADEEEAPSSSISSRSSQEEQSKETAAQPLRQGQKSGKQEHHDDSVGGADMREIPLQREIKKAYSGATIVRRATVEERNALREKEEARQRTSRREDSRGVRVTGIGVKTRMEAPAPEVAKFQDGDEESGKKGLRGGKKFAAAVPSFGKSREEEERAIPRSQPQQNKWRLSTRDILNVVESEPDIESSALSSRKRVIYTPNQQQRRRDLKKRKDLNQTSVTMPRAAYRVVKLESPTIVVGELAKQLSIKSGEIIKKLMDLNVMVTINQSVDFDTATLVAAEFGYECKLVGKTVATILHDEDFSRYEDKPRPPIVTVMGHVDHGKTSILDVIRKSSVTSTESGGITQHIGAYTVEHLGAITTFLDTPGHEAFSAMRARGSKVTDIVVLVVAADDGVMPQTKEAIAHAKNAGVPIIVAVNKIDKPNINLERVFTALSELGVQAEEWGGDTQFVQVSALKNIGIDKLLDAIKLQAEILELKARVEGRAEGVVLEAHLDKGVGPVATLISLNGVISVGDYIVAGEVFGKVRMMSDHLGIKLDQAMPAIPVQVVGLAAVPMAGDDVHVVASEKVAKDVVKLRREQNLNAAKAPSVATSLEELFSNVASAEVPQVPIIVKADTQGSVEAIVSSLEKLSTSKVKNRIVHSAAGGINESDINLAATSGAIIIGFNVRTSGNLATLAENKGVLISYFSIIYDVVDAVKSIMAGKLPPICTEVIQGHAEVRNAINVPRIGLIAGSAVTDGKITRSSLVRLVRDKIVIYKGKIGSLRRFKDDVKEVQHGFECGISIDGYNDVRVGDVIEAFIIEETAAKLELDT
jgi:translation initiation factor IF-2